MEDSKTCQRSVLLTGASGFLGSYMRRALEAEGFEIVTAGRSAGCDIHWDAASLVPEFNGRSFFRVVHMLADRDESSAINVNYEGTRRLLEAIKDTPPAEFVYISGTCVYGNKSDGEIDENTHTWAVGKFAQSKALTENLLRKWCECHGVILTILRPSMIFGSGMSGMAADMFSRVVRGTYVHIRDNNARLNVVMAEDVVRVAMLTASSGGTYNLSDGCCPTYCELADAMSLNAGLAKRPIFLPKKWGVALRRIAHAFKIPCDALDFALDRASDSEAAVSSKKIMDEYGYEFFPVTDVLARRCKNYPYQDTTP